jgi:hypothetical protein
VTPGPGFRLCFSPMLGRVDYQNIVWCQIKKRFAVWVIHHPRFGYELLTCSLRVIGQALQRFAQACKYRISKRVPFL